MFEHALTLTVVATLGLASGWSAWPAAAGHVQRPRPVERLQLPARPPQRQLSVPILMYHRITVASPGADSMERRLTVHPAHFAGQMRWLKSRGFRTISSESFTTRSCTGGGSGRSRS